METREKIKGAVDDLGNRAHQASAAMTERTKEGVDKAATLADTIGEKAHDVAAAVGEYAKEAGQSVSRMASNAADSVGHAKDKVADWAGDVAQHPGDYLKACTDNTAKLIRRYPITCVLAGIGLGFMLARVTRV